MRSRYGETADEWMSLLMSSPLQLKVLRQIITAGFIDQVAVRSDVALKRPARFTSSRSIPYRAAGITEDIFIHPSSALFHRAPPEFVVFQEIVRTSRPWMRVVTQINPAWLSALGKGMCSYSRPTEVGREGGSKVAEVKEGERVVSVVPHFRDLGVDLPAVKMRQRREGTRWVLVE